MRWRFCPVHAPSRLKEMQDYWDACQGRSAFPKDTKERPSFICEGFVLCMGIQSRFYHQKTKNRPAGPFQCAIMIKCFMCIYWVMLCNKTRTNHRRGGNHIGYLQKMPWLFAGQRAAPKGHLSLLSRAGDPPGHRGHHGGQAPHHAGQQQLPGPDHLPRGAAGGA